MAKDKLKLQVGIEGDNSGFRKELKKTERELQNFEKQTARGGFSRTTLLGLAGVQAIPAGIKAAMARKRFNKVSTLEGLADERMVRHQIRVGNDRGIDPGMVANMKRARQDRRAYRARLRQEGEPMRLAMKAMPKIMSAVIGVGLLSSVVGITLNSLKKTAAFRKEAEAFSGAIQVIRSQNEVRTIMRQIQLAQSPGYAASQGRLAQSEYALKMSGTSKSGDFVADATAFFNYLRAGFFDFFQGGENLINDNPSNPARSAYTGGGSPI